MIDSTGRSIDPQFGVNDPCSDGRGTEPAMRFRFAITWTSVTAHLEFREAAELTLPALGERAQRVKQSSLAAVAGVAVPTLIQRPETRSDPGARWEMVVPKMVRGNGVSHALTKAAPLAEHRNGDIHLPNSISPFASMGNSLTPLSRAIAGIGRRTRALLGGAAKPVEAAPVWSRLDPLRLTTANVQETRSRVLQLNEPSSQIPAKNQIAEKDDIKERYAVRELLLAKITSTLRNHSQSVDSKFERGFEQRGVAVEDPDKKQPRETVLS